MKPLEGLVQQSLRHRWEQGAAHSLGGPVSGLAMRIKPVTAATNSRVIATEDDTPLSPGAGVLTLDDCV